MTMRVLIAFSLVVGAMAATAAGVSGSSKGVSFSTSVSPESLRVTGPQGFTASVQGSSLQSASGLPDGLYRYEITAATGAGAPGFPPTIQDSTTAEITPLPSAARADTRLRRVSIVGGQVVSAGVVEEQ